MRMRISSALFVVVVLTLVWPSTSAFAQMGFVSGTVVDQQGEPIKDVTIRIEGLDSPRKYKLKTDKKGHYLHAGVPIQGRYRVIAEKKGYQSTYREGIKPGSSSSDERGIVNFEMAKGEAGILAFEMTDEQRKELEKQREEAIKQNEKLQAGHRKRPRLLPRRTHRPGHSRATLISQGTGPSGISPLGITLEMSHVQGKKPRQP